MDKQIKDLQIIVDKQTVDRKMEGQIEEQNNGHEIQIERLTDNKTEERIDSLDRDTVDKPKTYVDRWTKS